MGQVKELLFDLLRSMEEGHREAFYELAASGMCPRCTTPSLSYTLDGNNFSARRVLISCSSCGWSIKDGELDASLLAMDQSGIIRQQTLLRYAYLRAQSELCNTFRRRLVDQLDAGQRVETGPLRLCFNESTMQFPSWKTIESVVGAEAVAAIRNLTPRSTRRVLVIESNPDRR